MNLFYVGLAALLGWRIYSWFVNRSAIRNFVSQGALILDVRSAQEFGGGANDHSINIPVEELSKRLGELSNTKKCIACCASGVRSAIAARILRQGGFQAINGGSWKAVQSALTLRE